MFRRQAFPTDQAYLTPKDRATGLYVIGQPGTGKSRFIEGLALADMLAGNGTCIIDPHGDLWGNLTFHLAAAWKDHPDLSKRLVILDPTTPEWTESFNPLEGMPGVPAERTAWFLSDVISKVWKLNSVSSPRTGYVMLNAFLALSERGLTLLDLPRFLTETTFRTEQLRYIKNEQVQQFFASQFPQSEGAIQQWTAPLLNKIGKLIFDPVFRQIFAGPTTIKWREILDGRQILLVNIAKGMLGEEGSSLIGAFVVALLQQAALSRADTDKRPPFYLYLDEFQNYTTENVPDILAESRKYGLSLTLAHQFLQQLDPYIQASVLNTIGNMVVMRVGYHDAAQLVKEVFPHKDAMPERKTSLQFARIGGLLLPYPATEQIPLGWEGLTALLANLENRRFVYRRRGNHEPELLRSLNVADQKQTPELLALRRQLLLAANRRSKIAPRPAKEETSHDQPATRDPGGEPGKRPTRARPPLWEVRNEDT